jgi:hypothetical protein
VLYEGSTRNELEQKSVSLYVHRYRYNLERCTCEIDGCVDARVN